MTLHSTDAQVAQVAASIGRFGFNNPILVTGDVIVAGHARVRAAVLLNLKTVPTLDVSHMSDVEVRGYIIADNKIAENAGWDSDVLAIEAVNLKEEGVDPTVMGFTGDEDFFVMGGGSGKGPPGSFADVTEVETDHRCPKCGYEWSGSTK